MSEAVKPLAAGGSKDSHGTPIALIVRLGETSASEHAQGYYRVCHPDPPHKWAGFSVTEDCARRLLHQGRARVVRSSQKIRGICPVFCTHGSGTYQGFLVERSFKAITGPSSDTRQFHACKIELKWFFYQHHRLIFACFTGVTAPKGVDSHLFSRASAGVGALAPNDAAVIVAQQEATKTQAEYGAAAIHRETALRMQVIENCAKSGNIPVMTGGNVDCKPGLK